MSEVHLYGSEIERGRTQGFAADPDYWKGEVFAYVGLPQNLKDLKELSHLYTSGL